MRKQITLATALVILSATSVLASAETTNACLKFFLVSKQNVQGGQYFDRFPFQGLGYISSKPELVLERLKGVSGRPESSRSGWAVDREIGNMKKATIVTAERFFFTLNDEDAARLKRLSDKANPGQLVLVLFGDKAVSLFATDEIPANGQFKVIANWGRTGTPELADALKNLVH